MRHTPPLIKSEIIRKFLEGYSTTEIHEQLDVSVGTVSTITTDESKKTEYFLYMREIAKKFKKKDLEILDVISGIRLYNKIKAVGLDISFFENFIESTDTESFRIKKDLDKFLESIKRIIQFEEKYQIRIENIPVDMDNMIKQHKEIKDKKEKIVKETSNLYLQYKIKKSEIEEYIKEKPLFLQYKKVKETLPKYSEWLVYQSLFDEASKKIGTKIDPNVLYKKLKWVYSLPQLHTSIIKKVMAIDENNWFQTKK